MAPKKVHTLLLLNVFLLIYISSPPSLFFPYKGICWTNFVVRPVEFFITSVLTASRWVTYFSAKLVVDSSFVLSTEPV